MAADLISNFLPKPGKSIAQKRETQIEPEEFKRRTYLMSKGLKKNDPLQLNMMFDIDESQRLLPNDFARAALFTTCRGTRRAHNAFDAKGNPVFVPIFHLHNGVSVEYHGVELRAVDDELVFLQILHFASKIPMGEPVCFTVSEMVKALKWPVNNQYYERVRDSVTRLSFGKIKFRNDKAFGQSGIFSLIESEITLNDGEGKRKHYEVTVNKNMILFFAGKTFTRLNWSEYISLSVIARRLADYVRSHRQPYPLSADSFRQMCGFVEPTKTDTSWRKVVRSACGELVHYGFAKDVQLLTSDGMIYTVPND